MIFLHEVMGMFEWYLKNEEILAQDMKLDMRCDLEKLAILEKDCDFEQGYGFVKGLRFVKG